MSKIIASAAIRGSNQIALQAEQFVERVRNDKGEGVKIGFPDTAYFLPMAYALMGLEIRTLGDLKPVLAHIQELLSKEPAEKLWPRIREFWIDAGFLIRTEIPEAGVIETEWAENRAKIPQGLLRDLLGRAFENMHSSAERDKFRTRLERMADGKGTEIYISHRGLEEVVKDATNFGGGTTIWQPRPSDPELEAEFLRRLMVRLGAGEERAKQMMAAAPADARAQILKSNDGTARLQVNEPFDRTWRRVGLALDRVGFTVEDRDRQNGLYFVRYADADAEVEKQGLFSRILGLEKDKVKAQQYRIEVREGQGAAERSEVNVLNKDGARDGSATAQRILTLLHEQLK